MMVTNFGINWKYWLYMQLSLNLIIIIMANLTVLPQFQLANDHHPGFGICDILSLQHWA